MEPLVLASPPLPKRPRELLPDLFSPEQWRRLSLHLGLSRRQAQIAMRLTTDMRREDIAHELGITSETVRTHMRGLFGKLNVKTRVGMVVMLVHHCRRIARDAEEVADNGHGGNGSAKI